MAKKSKILNGSGQLKKKNIKFKDLDELINEPTIPVGVGTQVHCSGSDIRGVVVLNKQRKAMIDYTIDNKKKLATIPQFYKAVTGMPLHAKGNGYKLRMRSSNPIRCADHCYVRFILGKHFLFRPNYRPIAELRGLEVPVQGP